MGVSLKQLLKQPSPKDVMFGGIVMDVSLEQFAKQ